MTEPANSISGTGVPATTTTSIVPEKPAATAMSADPVAEPPKPFHPADKRPIDDYVMGYPKIATQMGLIPETAMFRRFGALNARNLLYLQCDLASIEEKLFKLEWNDHKSSTGKKSRYAVDAFWLDNATAVRDGDTKQRDLILRMRETVHQYNHALIQQRTIMMMERPDKYDLDVLQHFLGNEKMKNGALMLGADKKIWGTLLRKDSHSGELVVLKAREGGDSFSRKLSAWAVPLFERLACAAFKSPDPTAGVLIIKDDRVFKLTMWMTSLIASMMPVISIVILIKMKELNSRLGVIAAFNALLSVCLLVFTDARRTDVFSVTAAFAAVQVVFVGQVLDEGPKEVIITAGAGKLGGLCPC